MSTLPTHTPTSPLTRATPAPSSPPTIGITDEIDDCWESPDREKTHGPFKGRLANSIKDYPETLNLKLRIVLQPVGTRPLFYIEESEHPLAQEQQHGISYQLAMERASLYLHHRRTFR